MKISLHMIKTSPESYGRNYSPLSLFTLIPVNEESVSYGMMRSCYSSGKKTIAVALV
jgi:hypothetical protein